MKKAKKNLTRRALLINITALLMCASMLIGTTFAWFTDSVSSANNIITAGNLDVDVYYGDPKDEQSVEGVSELFDSVKLWEPGAVAYENLTVVNKGTLALKYEMSINFGEENYVMVDGEPEYGLSDILMIALVEGGVDETLSREELIASIPEDDWAAIDNFTLNGELLAKTNDETMGLVIWWAPSDSDNDFNLNNGKLTSDGKDHLHISLGVTLAATQYTYEEDSYDETYDKDATYPAVVGGTLEEGATEPLSLTAGRVTVKVPATAPAGAYKLTVPNFSETEDENGLTTVDTNIELTKDGVSVGPADYEVLIELDLMSQVKSVYHVNDEITNYNYDPFTGIISFKTDSFSPFSVSYDIFGKEVVVNAAEKKILRGFFEEINPATLDSSLLGDDSEYIAVDYVKDGVKKYAVSERATTVILGDKDDGGSGYTFENGNYAVTMVNDNALFSQISALQGNAYSTVYLLPGTYEEATTINVYSSMNIMGLGSAEDVKVIKVGCHSTTSKKPSNRHLFNCNGSKAEYIEVTLRNLHLDATEQNSYIGKFFGKEKQMFEDNAAVQSIRKTKVKCYDLDIVKGTNSSSFAFYANGNNAVNGVKYTAYLYAENCTLDTTREQCVVSTLGSYKFYHSGLTYSGTAYTKNSGSIKNTQLAWNDWDWLS